MCVCVCVCVYIYIYNIIMQINLHIAACVIRHMVGSLTPWSLGCGPESIRVRSDLWAKSGTGTDFALKASVFITLYRSTNVPHIFYLNAHCD